MNNILTFCIVIICFILCGCHKNNNSKENEDIKNQLIIISNRLSLTESILRYAVLKDTSTNLFNKMLTGEYHPKNVFDNKNLELLRNEIDLFKEDTKNYKYPKIELDNRNILYGVDSSMGRLLALVDKLYNESGSVVFSVRLINPTAIELISGQLAIYCDTQNNNDYKRKREKIQFNNLKSGESILLNLRFEDTNVTNIFEAMMVVKSDNIRFIEK